MDINSLELNLAVTALVAVVLFVLPLADRKICARLGVNLQGGLSANPNADRLLLLRRRILLTGLGIYLVIFAWLVFFSRSSSGEFTVHVAPLEDLKNAFSTPTGFSGWFRTLFTKGVSAAFSEISLVRPEDLSQFYLNMMLYVPLGYLLPYVFRWFRARVYTRPALFCLLLSVLVENLQLITTRGTYDFDDIISNTLGAVLGQACYIAFGYVVSHSRWKKDLREARRWRRRARRSIWPFTREAGVFRTTLRGSDPDAVLDFYVTRLGFRLRADLAPEGTGERVFLFGMGENRVRVICSPDVPVPDPQYLTIYAVRLSAVRERLEKAGVRDLAFGEDACTGLRVLSFTGPDHLRAEMIEAD